MPPAKITNVPGGPFPMIGSSESRSCSLRRELGPAKSTSNGICFSANHYGIAAMRATSRCDRRRHSLVNVIVKFTTFAKQAAVPET